MKRVYTDGRISVLEGEVSPGRRRAIVEHPGAVVILGLLDDGRLLWIRNRRSAIGQVLLELPAGTLEDGEEPAACAGRELAEETGYEAARLEPLGRFFAAPGYSTELLHAFLATGLRHVGQHLDETEDIEVEPLTWAETDARIRAGAVEDAKSLATVLLFRLASTVPGE